MSRILAPGWSKLLGAEMVIKALPGASGAIGLAEAVRRPADGHTIVVVSPPGEYLLQLKGRVPFKLEDFVLLGATNSDPGFIGTPAKSPYKTLAEVVSASRSGKRVTVGTVGRTSVGAVAAVYYQSSLKVKWKMVPFDGGSQLTTMVLGGHVDVATRQGGWYKLHPSRIRILAVGNDKRIKELPDVPTWKEAVGVEVIDRAVRGFAVRRGTPPKVINLLRQTLEKAAKSPEVSELQFKKTAFRYEWRDWKEFERAQQTQIELANRFKEVILGK